jgi:catabolite regulation protein CreA
MLLSCVQLHGNLKIGVREIESSKKENSNVLQGVTTFRILKLQFLVIYDHKREVLIFISSWEIFNETLGLRVTVL